MKRARALSAAAVVACLAAACTSFDFLTAVDDAQQPSAADCGACHVAIFEEFRGSAHAGAWNRQAFLDATGDHAIEDCLGCHAPSSIYVEGTPVVRDARREEGVTCLSCHFDGGAMVGPEDSTALADPHPVLVGRALYRSSELCGRCHEGTYGEWLAAPGAHDQTCQDCHMGRVRRTATQATSAVSEVLVAFEDEIEGRRHTFHVPQDGTVDDALDARLSGARTDDEATTCDVILTSSIPHLMPTGDFGFRWLRVRTEALSSSGSVLATRETSLFKELGDALRPGVPRPFPLTLPPESRALHVTVSTGKRSGPRITVYERTLPLP